MKSKDREKLSIAFRIGALVIAVIIVLSFALQSFMAF